MKTSILICLIAAAGAISCSQTNTRMAPAFPAQEDSAAVRQKVTATAGRKDVVMIQVPGTQGMGSEATTKALGMTFLEPSLSKSIRSQMKSAHDQGLPVYVGGPSTEKTAWALGEALRHSPPGSLAGLIIYTNAPVTSELQLAGRQARASVLKVKS
jgi:hypothetical protein